ncbi:MAG TPA: carbohydrate-binding protein [Chitinophaga sp.]|uniref:carbohydrate-binding protein n=1 Tax=Chitinophaga sp. TaxID=1869181 RepID=UPI002DB7E451|nr:carbohydrate-binding protein [Chitinophaga sp.]HEU4554123.1 carbohydrate-binding protein [Chitinophaga sp.]
MLSIRKLFALLIPLFLAAELSAQKLDIIIPAQPTEMETYAARDLARYIYQLSGKLPNITDKDKKFTGFILGRPGHHALVDRLIAAGKIKVPAASQSYLLKKLKLGGKDVIVIAANEPVGVLYGVYGLLEEHLGISFSFDGDVFPENKPATLLPNVDEEKTPAVEVRGFLPWTNFPQSATSYSWEDWKYILDQMARMRMNFLHIHNYNGEAAHNEMFHNFEVDGKLSRVWMATARTGHAWGSFPGWEVNKYPFGSSDLFDDYDFGADCALHNEKLDNKQVFRKGVNEFKRVIAYAHRRGIRIGLGLDIDLVPDSYGLEPDDPKVVEARVKQITTDYPDLDYLLCFQSEGIAKDKEKWQKWRTIFDGFYNGLKQASPHTRIAVAGWGLEPENTATLPEDVICAPISYYSDGFENGSIYGKREYWGCPWLERDFNSSVYYYPYNMDLSNTIKAWKERAPNMKGFYSLTWRITDAVKAKMWYMSRAPWDDKQELKDAETVYGRFAAQQYGKAAAAAITPIINQNEPYASNFSECRGTPPFMVGDVENQESYLFNVLSFRLTGDNAREFVTAAANYTQNNVVRTVAISSDSSCVGYIRRGSWTAYKELEFDPGWTKFQARVASMGSGGRIEIHLNAPDGPKIGEAQVQPTGDWLNWTSVQTNIIPAPGKHSIYLVYREPDANAVYKADVAMAKNELSKAAEQLTVLDNTIAAAGDPGQQYRLRLLRCRIGAEQNHIQLNLHFNEPKWNITPVVASWVHNFNGRVTDLSSLGNVVSMQNRFIQKNYMPEISRRLLNAYGAPAPENLQVKGTMNGALLTWDMPRPGSRGFVVYRNGERITTRPLPADARSYEDNAGGIAYYQVRSIRWDDMESVPSVPAYCAAGSADSTPPQIVVISPPTTLLPGQPLWIKARLLDGRAHELLMANLYYRVPGAHNWQQLHMTRRVKAVFTAVIPANGITADGLEYYITATDGANQSVFPADAPAHPLSLMQEPFNATAAPLAAPEVQTQQQSLTWQPVSDAAYYHIYRSQQNDFTPGPDNLLTYMAADAALTFTDNGENLLAQPLQGSWYYRIAAVDKNGYEGPASEAVIINN